MLLLKRLYPNNSEAILATLNMNGLMLIVKSLVFSAHFCKTPPRREVPEPAVRRLQTRRMPLWNAWDCFITENLVLPVMHDSVHSVLVKQHGYIKWTNCTKNTLLGN